MRHTERNVHIEHGHKEVYFDITLTYACMLNSRDDKTRQQKAREGKCLVPSTSRAIWIVDTEPSPTWFVAMLTAWRHAVLSWLVR